MHLAARPRMFPLQFDFNRHDENVTKRLAYKTGQEQYMRRQHRPRLQQPEQGRNNQNDVKDLLFRIAAARTHVTNLPNPLPAPN
jgi:hypothetical protein